MVTETEQKQVDSDVEEVTSPAGPIEISDDNNDDDICEAEHLRKLFIGGLAGQTNEETLRKFYGKWGTVVDTVVMRDPMTKRSRGFGFVTYSKVDMVDKAQSNRPHKIDGRTVESKRALPRPENQASDTKKGPSVKKLFVGGLKDLHSEECLKEYFSEFGNVISVQILIDNTTGKRRGFALIEYDDYDAVDKAILQKTHIVSNILLDVKKSVYTQDNKKKFTDKDQERNQRNNRDDGASYTNRRPPRPIQGEYCPMPNRNMMPNGPPMPPQASHYQMPPLQPYQQPQQQYTHMPPYQQAPPPNYNQWGPPPPQQPQPVPSQPPPPYTQQPVPYPQPPPTVIAQQQRPPQPMPPQNYGGYGQGASMPAQPPPPQTGNWNNYAPANGNIWSAPPPPPQPPASAQPPVPSWQNNQWGPPPSAPPPAPMPPGNPAPPNWQQPPAVQNAAPPPQQPPGPGMYQQPPQQQQQQHPPPPPPPPNTFGTGYQQNYGGGPTKHPNMYTNRMNPYSAPPSQYNNNPPPHGYGNGVPNGNRYRR